MIDFADSPYRVPFDGDFVLRKSPTTPPEDVKGKKANKKALAKLTDELHELQRIFYAHDKHALLLVFQAMDAAGKDGTIRAVMTGINPAGCQVYSFKQPSSMELDHDFLWRTSKCLPQRGMIGIFNRSYYEEVLILRVHPEYLDVQKLPDSIDRETIWKQRYQSIRHHEKHLARNATVILKFWLNVSKDEQKQRFLDRLNEPDKNWKFSPADVRERDHWNQYMHAYEDALNATSRPWAPWYAIPADDKPYMRTVVADIIARTMKSLSLEYPTVSEDELKRFDEMRGLLKNE